MKNKKDPSFRRTKINKTVSLKTLKFIIALPNHLSCTFCTLFYSFSRT